MGEYQVGEQRVRFWLEWDRATMGTRDLVTKFSTYAHYAASREWYREPRGLPLLLVVPRIALQYEAQLTQMLRGM